MPREIPGSGPRGKKRMKVAKASSRVPRRTTGTTQPITMATLKQRAQALQADQLALASDLFDFLIGGTQ